MVKELEEELVVRERRLLQLVGELRGAGSEAQARLELAAIRWCMVKTKVMKRKKKKKKKKRRRRRGGGPGVLAHMLFLKLTLSCSSCALRQYGVVCACWFCWVLCPSRCVHRFSSCAQRRLRHWHVPVWYCWVHASLCVSFVVVRPRCSASLLACSFAVVRPRCSASWLVCSFAVVRPRCSASRPVCTRRTVTQLVGVFASRCVASSCRLAQDARHHGRSGPEGQVP